jgi:hypothetical protein
MGIVKYWGVIGHRADEINEKDVDRVVTFIFD